MHLKDSSELKGLLKELEAPEVRPFAPRSADQFKTDLLRQLLQQHEQQGLAWPQMWRLWRFAVTVATLFVLLAMAVYFWAIISGPPAAIAPSQDVVTLPTRTVAVEESQPAITPLPTVNGGTAVSESNQSLNATVTSTEQANPVPFPVPSPPEDTLSESEPEANTGFQPFLATPQPHPQVSDRFSLTLLEAQAQVSFTVQAPTYLPPGFYFVGADVADVYPDRPDGKGVGAVFARPATSSPIISLHQNIVAENTPNFDEQERSGFIIQTVFIGGVSGEYKWDDIPGMGALKWQDNNIQYTLSSFGGNVTRAALINIAESLTTADITATTPLPDAPNHHRIWLVSAVQKARQSIEEPVTLELEVGYDYDFEGTPVLNVRLLPANEESSDPLELRDAFLTGGRPSHDLDPEASSQTIAITYRPVEFNRFSTAELENLVLKISIGVEFEEAPNRFRVETYATEFFPENPFDFTRIDEITYTPLAELVSGQVPYQFRFITPTRNTIITGSTTLEFELIFDLRIASEGELALVISEGKRAEVIASETIKLSEGVHVYRGSISFEPAENLDKAHNIYLHLVASAGGRPYNIAALPIREWQYMPPDSNN